MMNIPATNTPAQGLASTKRSRAAAQGAFLGFIVDNVDIYLPVVVLTPALAYFVPPTMDPATRALVISWIFVATLVARPLGALIFGHLADRIGRKRSTMIAIAGFGVGTLLIAVLPGYQQWGTAAIVVLVVLRFVDGVFLGGEYSGANVLAMEESPPAKRGLVGGLIQSGSPIAFVILTGLTLLMFQISPTGGVDSAYSQWGWRVLFVFGSMLAFIFVYYYKSHVQESSVWQKSEGSRATRAPLTANALRGFVQIFVLMTGLWFLLNTITAVMPLVMRSQLLLTNSQIAAVQLVMFAALAVVLPLGGALSQLLGRRRYLTVTGVLALLIGSGTYFLLIHTAPRNAGLAILWASAATVFAVAPWACVVPYLTESFRTEHRGLGYGLGYSLAVVIPSFYATYQLWLTNWFPTSDTVLALVAVGAVLVIIGALAGKETKDVNLDDSATNREPPPLRKARRPRATASLAKE